MNQISRQQIELLRRFRESGGDRTQEEQLSALSCRSTASRRGSGRRAKRAGKGTGNGEPKPIEERSAGKQCRRQPIPPFPFPLLLFPR